MGLFDIILDAASRNITTSGSWGGGSRTPTLLGTPLGNLAESFIDNVIRDKVSSPAIGSVVYCDLVLGYAEHSGIYIGNNHIVHLNGDGTIERVTTKQFMNRLDGFGSAISMYVSCNDGLPVGLPEAAKRAKSMIGQSREYNLIFDNCHQFTAGCLSGNFENNCNFLVSLKKEVSKRMSGKEWRVCDL